MYIAAAALFKLLLIGGEVVEEEGEWEKERQILERPSLNQGEKGEMKDGDTTTGIEIVQQSASAVISEAEFVTCDCCGLTEECTEAYIRRVRDRNQGRWICGLCTEAVKEEIGRSSESRQIGNEEALNRHMSFCKSFRSTSPPRKPTEELISAMKQLLLRSLDSPRTPRSSPGSPMKKEGSVYGRSASLNFQSKRCYSAMDR